jgi:surface protein
MSNNNNSWFRNLFRRRPTAEEELNAAAEERRQQARAAQNEATQRLAEARASQQREMAADRATHQQEMADAIRPPMPPPAQRTQETPITNNNIPVLIYNYIYNRNGVPADLRDIPIGNWDVSRVTNMSNLFSGLESFNEPLNDWNVSNVTNMTSMFDGATSFNQPLDRWNVSNVRNMRNMFNGASSFSQNPNWNIGPNVNTANMFRGTPLERELNPETDLQRVNRIVARARAAQAAQPQAAQTAVAATVGVAFEIHDAFDNFKMAKFMDIIRREITNNPPPENMSIYFQSRIRPLTALFEHIENREQINQLMTIQSTIISYPGYDTNRQNVIDVIKFVVTQPEEFITAYIQTLITDCMRAYSTGRTQSCVKGMYERVFFSIRDTVATVCLDQMQGTGPAPLCKPVYIELFECFYETWPKEGPGGLNEMTQEWYGDGERVTALSPENRQEDFVNFVRGKIEDPARFRQAEASIRKYAREDLQNMGLFGGKRRNKRSVKRKYNKRTNKRTNKRNKKTMKKRR